MGFLGIFLITSVVFFIGDIIWLSFVIKPFFIYHIKHLMNVGLQGLQINYVSAIGAYIITTLGLTHFVIRPLLLSSYQEIFLQGAFFGFCMYGVYELTNQATLASWPLTFLVVDLVWGTVWSGVVSVVVTFVVQHYK